MALEGDGDGKYYHFNLSELARQSILDYNATPHMAPDNSPGPPSFVQSSKNNTDSDKFSQREFSPKLSNGKASLELFLRIQSIEVIIDPGNL